MRKATTVPQEVKDRAEVLRLSMVWLLALLPVLAIATDRSVEWHQLKTYELAGQMFEDELDLAYAVMDGVEARSRVEGQTTQRFKF